MPFGEYYIPNKAIVKLRAMFVFTCSRYCQKATQSGNNYIDFKAFPGSHT